VIKVVITTTTIFATAGIYNLLSQNTPNSVALDPGKQIVYTPMGSKGFPKQITLDEKNCLIENVYHESRGETRKGQESIVYVVLNRSLSETRKYASTRNMCDIIKAPKAFSWVDAGVKTIDDEKAWNQAVAVVNKVLKSYSLKNSPVADATHYVNKQTATTKAKWWKSKKMTVLANVGSHTFLKQKNEIISFNKA